MSITFIEIEKKKSWRIGIFFLVLLFIYFCIITILSQSITPIFSIFSFKPSMGFILFGGDLRTIITIIIFSIVLSAVHFWFSARNAVRSVMGNLNAASPDPSDAVHKQLLNINEEIHVASGNTRRIECMVIPSLSMNALAVADLDGRAAIGITEGLLSRLTRPQLEAVVAHEAYHVLSGDCIEGTVAASLFGMYASAIEKFQSFSEGRAFFSPTFILAWILLRLSHILNMFISREREYRADAAAVRMTRNPLALAEALHILSRNWRGIGFIGSGLEMLCIVNTRASGLDESERWWADLFSTHPPIRNRIGILLRMARVSISELDAKAERKARIADEAKAEGPMYYALDPNQQWQGPFNLANLAALPWLSPLTWISTGQDQEVEKAWKDPMINTIFTERLNQTKSSLSNLTCPKCHQPLSEIYYKKTQVYQCDFCRGTLVENVKITRILARTESPCTERLKSLARAVLRENQMKFTMRRLKGIEKAKIPLLSCPKCRKPMMRTFHSLAYLIEIDRCGFCGMTWFDQEELEMLQCVIETRLTAIGPQQD